MNVKSNKILHNKFIYETKHTGGSFLTGILTRVIPNTAF